MRECGTEAAFGCGFPVMCRPRRSERSRMAGKTTVRLAFERVRQHGAQRGRHDALLADGTEEFFGSVRARCDASLASARRRQTGCRACSKSAHANATRSSVSGRPSAPGSAATTSTCFIRAGTALYQRRQRNLAHLLVGSEGTLRCRAPASASGAVPAAKVLGVVTFRPSAPPCRRHSTSCALARPRVELVDRR